MSRPVQASRAVNAFARRLGILALAGGTCVLAGCLGDAQLEEQTQAQAEIDEAGDQYRTLISGVGVDSDPLTVANKLDQLGRSLQSIKGTSSKQKQVATKLAASIAATSGKLQAMSLISMDLDLRAMRARIALKADAAMIIAAGAQVRMASDFSTPNSEVNQTRAGFQQPHQQIRGENSRLEEQITQVSQQRDRNNQQLDQMTTDSAQLSRQANNVSAIDGYPLVEESSQIRAKMIPIKTTIAEAEIQLAGLQPELARKRTMEENSQALIDATHRAEGNIESIRAAVLAAGQMGRERAQTQVQELKTLLQTYGTMQSEQIEPLMETALRNLNQAQRSGSSKGERQIAADASTLMGELHAIQASSDLEDARLYTALANTSSITGVDASEWTNLATEASTAAEASIAEARSAYETALEKLTMINGNEAGQTAVESLIKALDGVRIAPPASNNTAPAAMASGTASAATAGAPANAPAPPSGGANMPPFATNGMSSPQAICDFLNSMRDAGPGGMEMMQQMLGMMYISDASALPKLQGLQQQAMRGGTGAAGPARVVSERGDTAMIDVPGATQMPLMKVGGKWYIDVNKLVELMENSESNRSGGRGRGRN
ncbi:MAG: hypothetical protein CBC35_04760 [Planctomycetes bacterium TMED75]|nr:hypothetical protein [Planctomycetaceae bacterium]OUU93900.1 MAG: hypothetical protein CBC35_04760 [Planctomycetes bacterium TMED75]